MKKKSEKSWYGEKAGFFGPSYFAEYKDILTKEKTIAEVDFIEKTLALRSDMAILDCPCGHGRHSIELARRGYDVTGQDLNSFFLRKAKMAARRDKVSVRWVQGDMREISFEKEFDVALNLFTAFGYLESDEEDQKAICQIAKALRPGGRFFLDVGNRDRVIRTYREKDWRQLSDGSIITSERQFEHATGRNVERRVAIHKDGGREEFLIIVRMYTVVELIAMLRRDGLIVKETYGDYNGEPLTLDSRRYILDCPKRINFP